MRVADSSPNTPKPDHAGAELVTRPERLEKIPVEVTSQIVFIDEIKNTASLWGVFPKM